MITQIFELDDSKGFFIDLINDELKNKFRISEQFAGIEEITATGTHPFVILLKNSKANVFPGITIGLSNRRQENTRLGFAEDRVDLTVAEIDNILAVDAEGRISPTSLLEEVRELAVTAGGSLSVMRREDNVKTTVTVEVWSETNGDIKDKLLNIIYALLFGNYKRMKDERGYDEIELGETTDGMYNYDFGRTLFGGTVTLDFERELIEYKLDTDEGVLDSAKIGLLSTPSGDIKFNDPPT